MWKRGNEILILNPCKRVSFVFLDIYYATNARCDLGTTVAGVGGKRSLKPTCFMFAACDVLNEMFCLSRFFASFTMRNLNGMFICILSFICVVFYR